MCTELGSFDSRFSTVCNSDKYIRDVLSKGKKEQVHVFCAFSHFVIGSIFVSGQPSSIKRNRTRNPNRARLRIRARNTERGHLLSRSDLNELDLRFSSYRARYMSHSAANVNTGQSNRARFVYRARTV